MISTLGWPCLAEPSVHWLAPPECPQEDAVASALRAELPRSADWQEVSDISGQVTRVGPRRYRLQLSAKLDARTALRTLSAHRCDELVQAAVWLIVLAVGGRESPITTDEPGDAAAGTNGAPTGHPAGSEGSTAGAGQGPPIGNTETPSTPGSAQNERVAAGATAPADETVLAAARDAERRRRGNVELHARVAAFGGVFAGAGAKVQGTVGLSAGLSAGIFHTQLSMAGLLPSNESVAEGRHVEVWSLAWGVSECALWGQRFRAGPCAGLQMLRTSAHSTDFGSDIDRVVLWGLLDVGLQFLWSLTKSLELSVSGGAGVPITPRPRFTVSGAGVVASAAPWSQEARIGLIYVAR
jgi:hypothetical protein